LIILIKFTTEFGLSRASKAIDYEALLGMAMLLGSSSVEHMFKFFELRVSACVDTTHCSGDVEKCI
jgi:hypothetical protein